MLNRRTFLGATAALPLIKPAWLSDRNFLEDFFGITTTQSIFGDFWAPWKTVYKVTKIDGSSFAAGNIHFDYRLHYKTGYIVRPRIGKIFVFETLEEAKQCINNVTSTFYSEKYNIFKSKGKNCKSHPYLLFGCPDKQDFIRYWNKHSTHEIEQDVFHKDILVCDELKVGNRIYVK